jgi:hypothetical protein
MCNWLRDRTLSEKVSLGWSQNFVDLPSIELPDRRTLKTLADCRDYILAQPATERSSTGSTQRKFC